MRTLSVIIVAALILTLFGCTTEYKVSNTDSSPNRNSTISDAKSGAGLPGDKFATGNDANDITINGWKIEYPKRLKQLNITMIDGVMKIEFEQFSFAVRDNKIFINETNYGTAKTGDTVLVGFEGDVAVNGKIREPVSE